MHRCMGPNRDHVLRVGVDGGHVQRAVFEAKARPASRSLLSVDPPPNSLPLLYRFAQSVQTVPRAALRRPLWIVQ